VEKPYIESLQQIRAFDFLSFIKDVITGYGKLAELLLGSDDAALRYFAATAQLSPDMSINIGQGILLQKTVMDADPWGPFDEDSTLVYQMGTTDGKVIEFDISDLTTGQHKWALIQVGFKQSDDQREGDPEPVKKFYNTSDPGNPLDGPADSGDPTPSIRHGLADIKLTYGNPAGGGGEVPPAATAGYVPMYLINLHQGQTQVVDADIKVAGPDAYSGYPRAPFAGGLYTQHHLGGGGQAPQIDLTSEVQGILPFANLLVASTSPGSGWKLPLFKVVSADPNGTAGAQGMIAFEVVSGSLVNVWTWISGTLWQSMSTVGGGGGGGGLDDPPNYEDTFPLTISDSGVYFLNVQTPAVDIHIPDTVDTKDITLKRIDTNVGYTATIWPTGSNQIEHSDKYELVKGGDSVRLKADGGNAPGNYFILDAYAGG